MRLLLELQERWADVADRIIVEGREPSFGDLVLFLEERARVSRTRYGMLVHNNSRVSNSRGPERHFSKRIGSNAVTRGACQEDCMKLSARVICSRKHFVSDCPKFLKMDINSRRAEARKLELCYLCLASGHVARKCGSGLRCSVKGCTIKHHSLLHFDGISTSVNFARKMSSPDVHFGVIPVRVCGPYGSIETCAFLDSGSDTSLISEEIVHRLSLESKVSSINVTTINGTSVHECLEVSVELFSLDDRGSVQISKAYTIGKLPLGHAGFLTQQQLGKWKHLRNIPFSQLQDKTIGILIGCDAPDAHWVLEQRLGDIKHPFGVRTHLGWMVLGPKNPGRLASRVEWCRCTCSPDISVDLERLYNHEFSDVDDLHKQHSVEDKKALSIVESSTSLVDGHFQVGLPWKRGRPELPNNYEMAGRRLKCLRRRFARDCHLLEKYRLVMNRHLSKGYIVEVDKWSLN
ncbi:hypothetical protein MN116_000285 [Schistosoma mekongi]|uniref:CCHC-type domain-containing protein n=1 Tax=Schistosoma mekongi TaxID=38744 RepID=A0AAE2D158_SCHME|nr:hypothetical protein MN116_000285 [Schistosoma mekongi]